MKAMPYVLLLPLALIVLFTQCKKEPEPEPEPETIIRDTNFLNALIERGIDTNGDSLISPTEAEAVTELDVSDCDISDMSGIELFRFLQHLSCYDNKLTTLDISNSPALVWLNVNFNLISSLDLTNNTALEGLYAEYNQLSILNISNNIALKDVKSGNLLIRLLLAVKIC